MSDPKQKTFPSIPAPQQDIASLVRSVAALKGAMELLTGQRGSGENAAVLRKDSK